MASEDASVAEARRITRPFPVDLRRLDRGMAAQKKGRGHHTGPALTVLFRIAAWRLVHMDRADRGGNPPARAHSPGTIAGVSGLHPYLRAIAKESLVFLPVKRDVSQEARLTWGNRPPTGNGDELPTPP